MDLYSPPVNSRLGMEVPSGPVFCMHEFQGDNITFQIGHAFFDNINSKSTCLSAREFQFLDSE